MTKQWVYGFGGGESGGDAAEQRQHADVGLLFVNQGEPEAAVRAYLAALRPPLREVLLDPGARLGAAVGSRAVVRGRRLEDAAPSRPLWLAIRAEVESSIAMAVKDATEHENFPVLLQSMTANAIASVACCSPRATIPTRSRPRAPLLVGAEIVTAGLAAAVWEASFISVLWLV